VAAADFDSAKAAYVRGDWETAFVEYKVLADQGHAEVQHSLGMMYEAGHGAPEDKAEAAKWLRLAGEQGHTVAQIKLGYMYSGGESVPEDDAESVKLYWADKPTPKCHANRS
jgi:TPR repeat protein